MINSLSYEAVVVVYFAKLNLIGDIFDTLRHLTLYKGYIHNYFMQYHKF